MKKQYSRSILILACLLAALLVISSSGLAQSPQTDDGAMIRLQVATFDPLQAEPAVPANLKLSAYTGAGPYIVQFNGPVEAAWSEAVVAAGGQADGYLPDNAFIVRLDQDSLARVKQLDFVRWVGLYQPAYKLSPRLTTASPTHLYQVQLAGWADSAGVSNQLAALSNGVSGNGTALVVSAEIEQLVQMAQLPDVLWIEPFEFFETQNDVAGGIMGFNTAWTGGYTGAGQTVTIADTGLDTGVDNASVNGDIHLDFDNRVAHISSWPVANIPTCYTNAGNDDGADDESSGHGTHVAGSVAGNGARSSNQYRGAAYQANITFQAIEQYTTYTSYCGSGSGYGLSGIPDDLNDLFQEAYDWGSRIHTNSWGSSVAGEYTTSSYQADQFIWNHKNFTVLFSAGNSGTDDDSNGYVDEDSMGAPGTAKNVITIGASENVRNSGGYNPGGVCDSWGDCWPDNFPANPTASDLPSDSAAEMAAFSSRGPTDDGRIKPDLVAPGTNILSTRSSQATGNGWGAFNNYYVYMGGTSMATPLSAGATAVVRDYLVDGAGLTNPSAALIKAILINSAVDISGYGNTAQEAGLPIPNNHEGWGRLNLATAVNGTNRTLVDDHILTTGKTDVYTFTATGSATPLKVSVVWSDYPGSTSASVQLVNNLNLKVTAPNGSTTYWGNRFSNGWSTTGGSADTRNNVENVYIQAPATGQWKIEIIGLSVPHGPQPYALVVRGQGTLTSPPVSSISNVYLPVVIKASSGPQAGFWRSTTGDEFYVTTDRAGVNKFAVYVGTSCGNYKITHNKVEAIGNNSFSFSGTFYASGTFNSSTTASGTDGLSYFYISGCGYITGGPWSWNATWQNSNQPTFLPAQVVEPDGVEPVPQADFAKSEVTVTRIE